MNITQYPLDVAIPEVIPDVPPHSYDMLDASTYHYQMGDNEHVDAIQNAGGFIKSAWIARHNRMGEVVAKQLSNSAAFEAMTLGDLLAQEGFATSPEYKAELTPDLIYKTKSGRHTYINIFEFKMCVDISELEMAIVKYKNGMDIAALRNLNRDKHFIVWGMNIHPTTLHVTCIGNSRFVLSLTPEVEKAAIDCLCVTQMVKRLDNKYDGEPIRQIRAVGSIRSSPSLCTNIPALLKALQNTGSDHGLGEILSMTTDDEQIGFWCGLLGVTDKRNPMSKPYIDEIKSISEEMADSDSLLSESYKFCVQGDLLLYVNSVLGADRTNADKAAALLRQKSRYQYKMELKKSAARLDKEMKKPSQFLDPTAVNLTGLFKMSATRAIEDECVKVHTKDAKPSLHCLIPICYKSGIPANRKASNLIKSFIGGSRFIYDIISNDHPMSSIRSILESDESCGTRREGFGRVEYESFNYILSCIRSHHAPSDYVPEKIEKGDDMHAVYDIVSDGVNYYYDRMAGKWGGLRGDPSYLKRAGVGIKESKGKSDRFQNVVIVNQANANAGACHGDDVKYIDTRSRVLDLNCTLCTRDATDRVKYLTNWASLSVSHDRSTKMGKMSEEVLDCMPGKFVTHKNMLKNLNNNFFKSRLHHSTEAISTMMEGLLVQADYKRDSSVSFALSACPCTMLIRLSSGDLASLGNNVAFVSMQCIPIGELDASVIDLLVAQTNAIDYIYKSIDFVYVLSKPMRLDRPRIGTLTTACESMYGMFMTFMEGTDSQECSTAIYNAFSHCTNVAKSQLDIKDCLKYWIGLSFSDACNFQGYISEKFNYRVKTLNDMAFLRDIIKLFTDCINSQRDFKAATDEQSEVNLDGEYIAGGAGDIRIVSPFSNCVVTRFTHIANPCYAIQMQVQRGLHNPATNLLKMVEVPCKFESLYRESIDSPLEDSIRFSAHTFSGESKYSYNPTLVMGSTAELMDEIDIPNQFRYKLNTEDKMSGPISSILTFTSTKSCTSVKSSRLGLASWVGSGIAKSGPLHDQTVKEALGGFRLSKHDAKLRRILRTNAPFMGDELRSRVEVHLASYHDHDEKVLPMKPNVGDRLLSSKFKGYKVSMTDQDYIHAETTPAAEALYSEAKVMTPKDTIVNHLNRMITIDASEGMYSRNRCAVITMFEKHQRTSVDREIYISNMNHRTKLYFLERIYARFNKSVDEEMISVQGDLKTERIYTQTKFHKDGMKVQDKLCYLNIDESKWSASDVQIKFIHMHCMVSGLLPSEKLMLMLFQLQNCCKYVIVPEEVMARKRYEYITTADKLAMEREPLLRMTNNLKTNFLMVSQNWLQGNLNSLSSFGNAVSCRALHNILKEHTKERIKLSSMVHSDDASIMASWDISLIDVYAHGKSQSCYLLTAAKLCQQSFCITMNDKKSYASSFMRDFISEIVINGEFIENYGRYVSGLTAPCTYSNFKEDLMSLSSAAMSMIKRGCSTRMLYAGYLVMNYHIYHAYSMAPGEMQDPRSIITDIAKYPLDVGGLFVLEPSLLAVVGAPAHAGCLYYSAFHELQQTTNTVTKTTIADTVIALRAKASQERVTIPDLHSMCSFIHRNTSARDGFQLSQFDNSNVVKVALFQAQPKEPNTRCPAKNESFADVLVIGDAGINELLMETVKDKHHWYGKWEDNQTFRREMILKYHTKASSHDFKTVNSDRLRCAKAKMSNSRMYIACNLLEGVSKTSLKESISQESGLIELKLQLDILKMNKGLEKYQTYGGRDKCTKYDEDIREVTELLELERAKRLIALDTKFPKAKPYLNRLPDVEEGQEGGLRRRLTFIEALSFLVFLANNQSYEEKLDGFLLAYSAINLNDVAISNYCKALILAQVRSTHCSRPNRFMEVAKGMKRGILQYKAEQIVPLVLLPLQHRLLLGSKLEPSMMESDMYRLNEIVRDLGIKEDVDDLIEAIDELDPELEYENSHILAVRNHSRILYLLLCDIMNRHRISRVYVCSRGRFEMNPHDAFMSVMGNYEHSGIYSKMRAPDTYVPLLELDQMDPNYITKSHLRGVTQACVALIRCLYHIMPSQAVNMDLIDAVLASVQVQGMGLMSFLESVKGQIESHLGFLRGFIAFYYHMFLVESPSVLLHNENVAACWELPHKRDGTGPFRVTISTPRVSIKFSGNGIIVHRATVNTHPDLCIEQRSIDMVSIFRRLFADIPIKAVDTLPYKTRGFRFASSGRMLTYVYLTRSNVSAPGGSNYMGCDVDENALLTPSGDYLLLTDMKYPNVLELHKKNIGGPADYGEIVGSITCERGCIMGVRQPSTPNARSSVVCKCTNTNLSMLKKYQIRPSGVVVGGLDLSGIIKLMIQSGTYDIDISALTDANLSKLVSLEGVLKCNLYSYFTTEGQFEMDGTHTMIIIRSETFKFREREALERYKIVHGLECGKTGLVQCVVLPKLCNSLEGKLFDHAVKSLTALIWTLSLDWESEDVVYRDMEKLNGMLSRSLNASPSTRLNILYRNERAALLYGRETNSNSAVREEEELEVWD